MLKLLAVSCCLTGSTGKKNFKVVFFPVFFPVLFACPGSGVNRRRAAGRLQEGL